MTELKTILLDNDLVGQFDIVNFIETGCYQGDGIQCAIDVGINYPNIRSCDINMQWVLHCLDRFSNNVSIVCGPSAQQLPQMCVGLVGPTLVWLDAHLPEMYGLSPANSGYNMPVIEEICQIKNNKFDYQNDVIVIDDTRIINSTDNPRYRPGENICCEPITNLSINMIEKELSDTHRMIHVLEYEGYLLFLPLN